MSVCVSVCQCVCLYIYIYISVCRCVYGCVTVGSRLIINQPLASVCCANMASCVLNFPLFFSLCLLQVGPFVCVFQSSSVSPVRFC